MRKLTRATTLVGAVGLLVTLLGPAAVTPVYAAPALTVGCPGSIYSGPAGIQDAVDAAPATGATITVCAGTYNPVSITKDNIKLKGKGNPVIRPPASGFYGNLLQVGEAHNVTIQGFTLDGYNRFAESPTNYMRGILFFRSSGTIAKNYIVRIRRNPATADPVGTGIDIQNGVAGTPLVVKVIGNTIYDYQHYGIWVFGNVKPTIQKNVIMTAGNASIPTGIRLEDLAGGMVAKNTIQSDYTAVSTTTSIGIAVLQTSNVKVISNKLRSLAIGVTLSNWCPSIGMDHTSNNTVSKNTMTNAFVGVQLQGMDSSTLGTVCDASVDHNKVTNNKLTSLGFDGTPVLLNLWTISGTGHSPVVTLNTVTGNKFYGYILGVEDISGGANTISGNHSLPVPPGVLP